MCEHAKMSVFHLVPNILLFSPVGFKGNLSLLDIFFSRGLKQMEGKYADSGFTPNVESLYHS